jgi:hypothetical protein
MIVFLHVVDLAEREAFEETARQIELSLIVDPAGESGDDAGAEDGGYEESAEPEEPYVDPDAAFDAVGEFETLGMLVSYPSDIFTVSEQTDQYMILEDVYGHGASFMVLIQDVSLDSDASVYRQLLNDMVSNSMSEQSDVSLGEMRDVQISGLGGYAGSEIEASYTDSESGQGMNAIIALQFWSNASTGVQYPVVYLRAWPQSESAYAGLLSDIKDSLEDV